MATVQLSNAQASGFIPQFWANRALDVLRANTPLSRLVQSDKSFGPGDFSTQGSTLTIPYPGKFTAVDKVQGTPVTPQVPVGGSSVAITLSKHKVVPFSVEDFANAQANLDLMDRFMSPAVIAIAEQFETDLAALYAGLQTKIGTAGTAITAATLRTAKQTFLAQKAPMDNRSLIVSGGDEASLLGDTTLQTYFAFSQNQALKEGSIGRLYGFDIFSSQLVPVVNDPVYTVTIGGTPTGGTWSFVWNGTDTELAFNATGATVQTALAARADIGAGNITVTGSAGGPYTISFVGTLIETGLVPTVAATNLTGGTPTAAIVSAGASSNKNLAIAQDSFMFATRPFRDPGADSGVKIATAIDPQTGLSIRVAGQYDINAMAYRCNVDVLYGMVVLRPGLGMVVES